MKISSWSSGHLGSAPKKRTLSREASRKGSFYLSRSFADSHPERRWGGGSIRRHSRTRKQTQDGGRCGTAEGWDQPWSPRSWEPRGLRRLPQPLCEGKLGSALLKPLSCPMSLSRVQAQSFEDLAGQTPLSTLAERPLTSPCGHSPSVAVSSTTNMSAGRSRELELASPRSSPLCLQITSVGRFSEYSSQFCP